MTVVTTILGLKLGNVVQPSPYRPADMDWNRANATCSLFSWPDSGCLEPGITERRHKHR
ncbi:hypothetical protein ACFP1C_12885 [Levilactobacillus fujinensis]|uniref:Uncharacterized protein n=1 Tax=Levilactobacillus fujinensis TaxID=2486024 RepID=A0ABW1TJE3_9LACO